MAEALPTNKILCRYFQHGVCWYADKCPYSHDRKDKPNMICTHYQQGNCAYGASCRYDHIRPSKTVTSSKRSNNLTSDPIRSQRIPAKTPFATSNNDCNASNGLMSPREESDKLSMTFDAAPMKFDATEWVNAPEFVPGQKWIAPEMPVTDYSQSEQDGDDTRAASAVGGGYSYSGSSTELCPYAAHGECQFGENCTYTHGDICELCSLPVLSPWDEQLRNKHIEECIKEHEKDMELSFAIQRSKDKICGICMDVIWEKAPNESRFGILSDCSHTFCLECIRKWRSAKQFENKIIRACPECRVKSDFVTPSQYWVEDKADKASLIDNYKHALSQKPCKYFEQGRGECPFNEKCFYRHAYPDGRPASPRPTRRRHRENASGEVDVVRHLVLWDVIQELNERRAHAGNDRSPYDLDDLFLHLGLHGLQSSDDDDDSDDDDEDL